MAILSFQSSVAYGHVGHAAAVFSLQRTGREVWPIDTVAFSNHPGYGSVGGGVHSAASIIAQVDGLARLGVLGRCRGVLSGYLGSAANGRAVLDAVARVRAESGGAPYCCDPVMGDYDGGLYVDAELVRFFQGPGIAAADILVPNQFEFEVLAGRPLPSLAALGEAATPLLRGRARLVAVTSVSTAEVGASIIANLAITRDGAWLVATPRLPLLAKGSGDILSALLFAGLLEGTSPPTALAAAVSSVFAAIEASADARELRLIAAQAALAVPQRRFVAERLW